MKKALSKTEAKKKIDEYFKRDRLDAETTRKIRRLAMKYRIRLGSYRQRFCKKCLNDLKDGKSRVARTHKTITCQKCDFINRVRIK